MNGTATGDGSFFAGKHVLVTGACGTIGQEIIQQLANRGAARVLAVDNDETGVFFLASGLAPDSPIIPTLGDVRDADFLRNAMAGVDIVFHGAALKHVVLGEYAPFNVVQTNILGVQNVIQAALENRVERVIFMSSDKAVNPTNVMGTSKLMGERLITAANILSPEGGTIFASSRFGNVLGSRGSALPLFARQIRKGEAVTLTDERMTRFVMTRRLAVDLVLQGATLARGGEIFVSKMPVMRIPDLIAATIDHIARRCGRDPKSVQVKEIGAKPGEKLHEELLSEEEVHRTREIDDQFVVLPAFRSVYRNIDYDYAESAPTPDRAYRSDRETPLPAADVRDYLARNKVFETLEE